MISLRDLRKSLVITLPLIFAGSLSFNLMLDAGSAYATFPGTNGLILYQKGGQYYTADSNGDNETVLSTTMGSPRWSPDGRKILYTASLPSGIQGIYVMNRDESSKKIVVNANSSAPQWVNDGSNLIFNEPQPSQPSYSQLSKIDITGSNKMVLAYYLNGELSPDGDKLASSSSWPNYPYVGYYSNILSPVGSPKPDTTAYSEGSNANTSACSSWSPDSKKIAFWISGYNNGGRFYYPTLKIKNIGTGTLDSYDIGTITSVGCPVWSPDGTSIVYASDEDSDPFDAVNDFVMIKFTPSSNTKTRLIENVSAVSDWQATPSTNYSNIYRFYSPLVKHHLFTANANEADYIRSHYPSTIWQYEGIAYRVNAVSNCILGESVYRFYSETLKTHLFTMDDNEKNYLTTHYPSSVWRYEGVAFCADKSPAPDTKPVYRFYSETLKTHLYTIDENEAQYIKAHYPSTIWRYEAVAYYAYTR